MKKFICAPDEVTIAYLEQNMGDPPTPTHLREPSVLTLSIQIDPKLVKMEDILPQVQDVINRWIESLKQAET